MKEDEQDREEDKKEGAKTDPPKQLTVKQEQTKRC